MILGPGFLFFLTAEQFLKFLFRDSQEQIFSTEEPQILDLALPFPSEISFHGLSLSIHNEHLIQGVAVD